MHTVSLAIALAIFWLLNSGHYTALLLTLGLASVVFVVWIAHRMDVVDHESQPIHMTMWLPSYYAWLFKQIVLSNIDVVRRVWRGSGSISPTLGRVPMTQRTDMGQVIYGNSITLTPGTVTIDIGEDHVLVHALSRDGFEALKEGEMDRRVRRLEGNGS